MSNISKDEQFESINFVKVLREKESPFLHNLQIAFQEARELMANRTPCTFPNYTLHNIEHSIRIADYMYELVVNTLDNTESIGELDIVILLYSTILHDIGMVVSDDDIKYITNDNYLNEKNEKYPIQLSGIKNIDWIKDIENEEEQEKYAIQEYIRRIHGFRAKQYVIALQEERKGFFSIPDFSTLNFHEELALICQSHNESYNWIIKNLKEEQIKGKYKYSPQFCACLLRIADILDIDERRTPSNLFKNINPKGKSKEEWLQHRVIQNTNKIIHKNNKICFEFIGECSDAIIHRKIYHYLDWVKEEIIGAKKLIQKLPSRYFLDLDVDLLRKIEPKGNYTIPDNRMSIDYKAISTLLMGEKIYGNKKIGLRELLQNAMDACQLRSEIENRNYKIGDDKYEPCIKIILDEDNNEVRIKDNGIGMNLDVINKHFLSIGKSYYKSDEFKIRNYDYQPIGTFGIGFLASFMLSDKVLVKTKHLNSNILYEIELEQGEEYSCIKENENNRFEGTEIILDYDKILEVFEKKDFIREFIRENVISENIKYILFDGNESEMLNVGFNKSYDLQKELLIDISNYLSGIEGYISIKKDIPIYEKIADFNIEATLFYYENGEIISDRTRIDEILISKITKSDILEYFLIDFYDTPNYEHIHYYIFYDNNTEKSFEVENVATRELMNKKIEEYNNEATVEINLYQMYLYSGDGKYHYSIPYYSEHKEDQNLTDIDEVIYNPLGDFIYNEFNIGGIFNNGIYVPNDDYSPSWLYEHYTRFSGLEISEYSLNIKPGLALNVSRNSFYDSTDIEALQYAIYKAAHIAFFIESNLNDKQKTVLDSFTKIFFHETTKYCITKED